MAPDQRGEVGDIVVLDIHALLPDVANGLLHVDGVPVDDRVKGEAQGAELLFLPLLKWAADFPAFAMMNAAAEAMAQFRVVELGQNAPPESCVVDVYPAHPIIRKSFGLMTRKLSAISSQKMCQFLGTS